MSSYSTSSLHLCIPGVFLGAKGKDGVPAATHPSPGAVQDRRQAHLSVQRGDQKPVRRVDGDPGGDGSLRLRGAATEGLEPGKSPPKLYEQTQ